MIGDNDKYSWMLQGVVDDTPHARHLVLLSADGVAQGASHGLDERPLKAIAATVAGLQSLSRATGLIVGPQKTHEWKQTLIEFDHGLVFVVAAGKGSYLAAAAGPDVDMQQISFNMQQLVTRLGRELTAPARTEPVARRGSQGALGGQSPRPARVLPVLNDMLAAVPKATRAILVQPDGMPGGASEGMNADIADLFAAAMHGLQGLSKSTGPFAGLHGSPRLRQTVVEFSHGWLVSISTGDGGSLAAMAEPEGDIGELAGRMHDLVSASTQQPAAQMARNV